MENEVKLFMVFDILGDTERTGPLLWQIKRERLEDVKNHIFDLILITRILKKFFPPTLDYDKMIDYIICHDLPEAITGDITKFEGVPDEERTARFVCAVAAVFPDGTSCTVRETIEGQIAHEIAGDNGFGYDPIFYVPEYGCTTAQMDPEQKNLLSHRGKALRAMKRILEEKLREES